ncbi:MAG: hypothetical protein ACF8MF_13415 [Phycisphaerales bacterium JB052]
MVWAPAFTIIMLLLFGHYSIFKLMRDECRLAADSHGTVRVDLAEPKVLLDERKLVVPNLITKRVYTPERVRMWCSGSSPDAYAGLDWFGVSWGLCVLESFQSALLRGVAASSGTLLR